MTQDETDEAMVNGTIEDYNRHWQAIDRDEIIEAERERMRQAVKVLFKHSYSDNAWYWEEKFLNIIDPD